MRDSRSGGALRAPRNAGRRPVLIATLTLNAALDLTFHPERLEPGQLHGTGAPRAQAGGKGVNVSRVLHATGVPTLALVVVGGQTGRHIVEDLERSGIPHRAVVGAGESRTCLELVERDGRTTQLHGGGVRADGALLERVQIAVRHLPPATRWLALCGSVPPEMPSDTLPRLMREARERGCRVAVDTRGAALRAAAAADPDLLRINRDELAEALACDRRELRDGAHAPLGRPELMVVSDAARTVVCWPRAHPPFRVQPPEVDVVNPIGCGDAMHAGLLAALDRRVPLDEALRRATALAAAEATSPVAGRPDLERAAALLPEVRILDGR